MGLLRKILNEIEEDIEGRLQGMRDIMADYNQITLPKLKTTAKAIIKLAAGEEGRYREIVSGDYRYDAGNVSNQFKVLSGEKKGNDGERENALNEFPLDLERKFPTFSIEIRQEKNKNIIDALKEGTILRPSYIYSGDIGRRKDLGKAGIQANLDVQPLLDLSRPTEINQDNLQWQYEYLEWDKGNKVKNLENGDYRFISNQNRYIRYKDFDANVQSDLLQLITKDDIDGKRLTEIINNCITGGNVRTPLIMGSGNDWHIKVAKAFIQINNPDLGVSVIPAYGDTKLQEAEMKKDEENEDPLFIGVNVMGDNVYPSNGVGGTNIPLQVDHINGDNTNNSAKNLRIVQAYRNTAEAHIYRFFKWNIKNRTDIPIYARLEYRNGKTEPHFYSDNEFTQELTINDNSVECTRDNNYLLSSENQEALTSKEFIDGETEINPQKSGVLYEVPIVIRMGNKKSYKVKSAQQAGFMMNNRTSRQIINWARISIKHQKRDQMSTNPDDVVYVGFATNQVETGYEGENALNEANNGEAFHSKDPEYSTRKIKEIIRNYGNGTENNSEETIGQIIVNLKEANRFNNRTEGGVNVNIGTFYVENRDSLDDDYRNFHYKYKGETWHRGIYFSNMNNTTAGKLKRKGVEFLVAQEVKNKEAEDINDIVVFDATCGATVTGKGYTVMCSNMNRVAFYNERTHKWEIRIPGYLTQYPSVSKLMDRYKYTPDGGIKRTGGPAMRNILDKDGNIIGKKPIENTLELHILIMSTLRYNEYLRIIQYCTEKGLFSGDYKIFVHHRNEDTSIFAYKNLELVSNYDNSLFSRGFTCMVLFERIGEKEIPIIGWRLGNQGMPIDYDTRQYINYISPLNSEKISIGLPSQAVAIQNMHNNDFLTPSGQNVSNGRKFLFRECLTKDFRTQETDAFQIAQLVVAYINREMVNGKVSKYVLFKSIDSEGEDYWGGSQLTLEAIKEKHGLTPVGYAEHLQIDQDLQLLSRRELIEPKQDDASTVFGNVIPSRHKTVYKSEMEPYEPFPNHSTEMTITDPVTSDSAHRRQGAIKYDNLKPELLQGQLQEHIKRIRDLIKRMK